MRDQPSVIAVLLLTACAVPAPEPAREPEPLAIGTFNIRYANPADGSNAWAQRREMVGDVLRDGDVWGLQEVLPEQVAALREDLPEFGMVVRSRERDPATGEACPVLFRTARWALDLDDHGTFWLSESPDVPGSRSWDAALPRIATFARLVDRVSGRALYVFNAHFDHRGAVARLESARLLARRIAARRHEDPVVVLGDFNAGPSSDPLRALLEASSLELRDAWVTANPSTAERGTFNGWGESLGTTRIDHVLTCAELTVVTCDIDERKPAGRWPSDHAAVRALVRFED